MSGTPASNHSPFDVIVFSPEITSSSTGPTKNVDSVHENLWNRCWPLAIWAALEINNCVILFQVLACETLASKIWIQEWGQIWCNEHATSCMAASILEWAKLLSWGDIHWGAKKKRRVGVGDPTRIWFLDLKLCLMMILSLSTEGVWNRWTLRKLCSLFENTKVRLR